MCNPRNWQIDDYLNDLKQNNSLKYNTWTVPKWQKNEFHKGQYGIIRVGLDRRTRKELGSRKRLISGVYAIIKIISDVKKRPVPQPSD